jgi:hypothetical protein
MLPVYSVTHPAGLYPLTLSPKGGEGINAKGKRRRFKPNRRGRRGKLFKDWCRRRIDKTMGCTIRSAVQLIEHRFGIAQVGGVETLGEPIVDLGEGRARLVALALGGQQPRETRHRTQLP